MTEPTTRGWNLQAPWQVGIATLVVLAVALLASRLGPERYPADLERAITIGVVVMMIGAGVVIADIAWGWQLRALAWIGLAGAWALLALAVSGPDPSVVWLLCGLAYFGSLRAVARRERWRLTAGKIVLLLVFAVALGFAIWALAIGAAWSSM